MLLYIYISYIIFRYCAGFGELTRAQFLCLSALGYVGALRALTYRGFFPYSLNLIVEIYYYHSLALVCESFIWIRVLEY